jgi:DNA-binding response OmpR family regulator
VNSKEPKRILIADDDSSIRAALCATLEADGYDVEIAIDGRMAIEALLNNHFDLAILDLAMPHVDGLEVLKELQIVRSGRAVPPILVLTAYGSVTAAVESARYGAIDFLHKPILPESLRASVRDAISGATHRPLVDRADNYVG